MCRRRVVDTLSSWPSAIWPPAARENFFLIASLCEAGKVSLKVFLLCLSMDAVLTYARNHAACWDKKMLQCLVLSSRGGWLLYPFKDSQLYNAHKAFPHFIANVCAVNFRETLATSSHGVPLIQHPFTQMHSCQRHEMTCRKKCCRPCKLQTLNWSRDFFMLLLLPHFVELCRTHSPFLQSFFLSTVLHALPTYDGPSLSR